MLVKGLNGDDRHTLHVCPLSSRRVIIEFFLVYVTETFLISLILLHVQYTPTVLEQETFTYGDIILLTKHLMFSQQL